MRVALLSWESLYSISVGGLAPHVTRLAEALYRHGNEVHIFTRKGQDQKQSEKINGVVYHRCNFDKSSNFVTEISNMCNSFSYNFFETVKDYGKFDVVHGHDWLTVNALSQIKDKSDAKIIFTIHSTEYGRSGNKLHEGTPRVIRDLEWYGGYIADKVITISRQLKDEVMWLYNIPSQKMSVIYNGIDLNRFDLDIDTKKIRDKFGISQSDPLCLFIGRMTEQKGPDLLLEAIPSVLRVFFDAKFVFVGDGHLKNYLKHRAFALGVYNACRFLGQVSEDYLTDLYKASDLVCIPSRNGPFGLVVLEAWCAGKPIVVTKNESDYVENGINGLTVNIHPDSVAWGIKEILWDKKAAKRISDNGKIFAGVFSWDNIASKTLRAYTI